MTTDELVFSRGKYGEILPPPLLDHVNPTEALNQFRAFSLAHGKKIAVPTNRQVRHALENLAALFCHQVRLRAVIAGTAPAETPTEASLRAMVMTGTPLSIRPLTFEETDPEGFAPVLQKQAADGWLFGLPDHGRSETFTASPAEAVERAQGLYVAWRTK